jgi:hypothetical protein
MWRLSLLAGFLLAPVVAEAQTAPLAAKMGITPTTPQLLQVFDQGHAWVTLGAVDSTLHLAAMGAVTQYTFGAQCNSNGTTGNGFDDTTAIQAAVNQAQATGRVFHLVGNGPGLMCRTTAPINITAGLRIDGDDVHVVPGGGGVPGNPGAGSWLYADHTGAAINIQGGATPSRHSLMHLSNFGVIRNQPPFVKTGSWTPTANGFDIESVYAEVFLDNILLWNATNGVRVGAAQTQDCCSRLTINGLRGEPFQVGIEIDSANDVTHLDNVHLYPHADAGLYVPVNSYRLNHGIGLKIERADGLDLNNYLAIYENQCIGFYQNTKTGSWGTSLREQWNGVYCDENYQGIYIDSAITTAGQISVQADNVVLFGNSDSVNGGTPLGNNGYNNFSTSPAFVRFDFGNLEISNYQNSLVYAPSGVWDRMSIGRLRTESYNLGANNAPGFFYYGTLDMATNPLSTSASTTPMFAANTGVYIVAGVKQPLGGLSLSGSNPSVYLNGNTQPANQKNADWVLNSDGSMSWQMCNDVYSACNNWLNITRTGYTPQTLWFIGQNIQLQAPNTYLIGGPTLGPQLLYAGQVQPLDEKKAEWDLNPDGSMTWKMCNDAYSACNTWQTLTRTGYVPTLMTYTVPIRYVAVAIANLATCNANIVGGLAFVNNGIAAPTYHQAVSTTGGGIWPVFCTYNGSAYGWVY